jgi:hypothetical protein
MLEHQNPLIAPASISNRLGAKVVGYFELREKGT